MIIQPIIDIPEICFQKGIKYAIISPGSRNALLSISFARHPGLEKIVIPDERSAAYVAMGIAQATQNPVAIICTSGTATVNLYPAITESYYQNVPLLVLTADRPALWIDKNDGQTVRQKDLYQNHIKKSYVYPEEFVDSESGDRANKMIDEAINIACQYPMGPVHVNIPIPEPFYPEGGEELKYSSVIKILTDPEKRNDEQFLTQEDLKNLSGKKVAIVVGQHDGKENLSETLKKLSEQKGIPIFADTIANVEDFEGLIRFHDSFSFKSDELKPDVIISYGRSILSKNLKLALRNNQELIHWHVQENDYSADTYLSLKKVFRNSPHGFFERLLNTLLKNDEEFMRYLVNINRNASEKLHSFIAEAEFGEFKAFSIVLDAIPSKAKIHLANSMPVRYANILGGKDGIRVFSNRGTSGIDGSNSTAVGHGLAGNDQNYLLTGDMAFFYDRNAFWHDHVPKNLKIIIFNNHGGGIFRLIDGPSRQPELEKYFETNQKLLAENTALDFGLEYYFCNSENGLLESLPEFITNRKTSILEIETNNLVNQKVFEEYKKLIKDET